jgi:hypothetical protein
MNSPLLLSAYLQLRPAEKTFVDRFVEWASAEAAKNNERISNVLLRPLPPVIINSHGEMLKRPMVSAAITERVSKIAADSELTVSRIVREVSNIAFANIGDAMKFNEETGDFTGFALSHLTPDQLAAISQIEINDTMHGRRVKIRYHSKLDALKMLAQYAGMLEADNEFWRAENAKPVNASLPVGTSDEDAANRYARMIE